MIYAGILAGGKTGVGMPIQFSLLGNKPIIIHTLEQFIINRHVDKIIITAPKDWIVHCQNLLQTYYPDLDVIVIEDGENKNMSIIRLIQHIIAVFDVDENDLVLCHDAIRPFVTQRIINDNIIACKQYGAVNTVVPPVDTMIISKDGKVITEMPNRGKMFAEQTPQTFNIQMMKEIIETSEEYILSENDDAAKLCFMHQKQVHLVRGEYSNIKIVTAYDIEIANSLTKEDKNT